MIEPRKLTPDGQPFPERGQVVPLSVAGQTSSPLAGAVSSDGPAEPASDMRQPSPEAVWPHGYGQPVYPPVQPAGHGHVSPGFVPPPAYVPQGFASVPPGFAPPPHGQAPASPKPEPAAPAPRLRHAINRQKLVNAGMLVPDGGPTAQTEEFRIVKRQLLGQVDELRRMGSGPASQRIMISSPHPGEGKTFCSVNLAMSIAAEKEAEVVLVDLDLARSSALDMLGIQNGPGLMDALVDPRLDVRSMVIPTDIHGLSVLPGGRPTNSDAEYLASSRAPRVLDMLTQGAPRRILIIDTPPALAAMFPAEVAKLVGQVVLVVLADKTSNNAVQDAASLLAGCPNIQLLLNAVQFSPSGRRFGSYHGYRG